MNNYNKLALVDEAASTEMSFNAGSTPQKITSKSANELVTSIHELETPKEFKFEKPSYRILIKTISTHTMEEVNNFQGIKADSDKDFISLHLFIRTYLLLANIMSGIYCGLTAVMGKIFIITCSKSSGILDTVTNLSAWISGLSVFITVFSNLVNVNKTISLYS